MGKTQSREQVIIAQTAGGDNNARAAVEHINTNNILLSIICACMLLAVLVRFFWLYKRLHTGWMQRQMRNEALERVLSRLSYRRRREIQEGALDESKV